ncbi:MAG: DNA double-strand break repair nuclease NurA [Candidatus Verstraetearchaeota archaeon]|jgi:hypothetical protein|nr:DNA double-strand break repair nuclease NurA [Candidatus Verstraetearchaeota archaeon]
MPLSEEEIRRILRKIEFDKTEPKLLVELVNRAIELGDGERRRVTRMKERCMRLLNLLKENAIINTLKKDDSLVNSLRRAATGALDGSFQVISGYGGRYYTFIGLSIILAREGFTVDPEVLLDGLIIPIECSDESEANKKSSEIMLWCETRSLRGLAERLIGLESPFILLDGPIVDPPLLRNSSYVQCRTDNIKSCINRDVTVIGFVKRIIGTEFMRFLQSTFNDEIDLSPFSNDLDLLTGILYFASLQSKLPVYTTPFQPLDFLEKTDPLFMTYSQYDDFGVKIYQAYYKPNIRSKVYRIELASTYSLYGEELRDKFEKILTLINYVWTLPGMNQPLPILLAHEKCSVRRGAAEKLYYEVITRGLTEEEAYLWIQE